MQTVVNSVSRTVLPTLKANFGTVAHPDAYHVPHDGESKAQAK